MKLSTVCRFTWRSSFLCLMLVCSGIVPAHGAVRLLITDDNGVQQYNFSTDTLSTLVPTSVDTFSMTGLAIGPNGNLFVAANGPAPQIFQYDASSGAQIGTGPFVFYQGTPPSPDPHDVINPQGIGFSPLNNNLYVGDISGSTANVHIYDGAGDSLGALGDPTLVTPNDVAFDSSGNMYVVNPGAANVLVSPQGTQPLETFVATQSGGLTNPTALTFGPDGKLYFLDLSTASIYRYESNGDFDTVVVPFGLFQPNDLAFGPDGKLYVSGVDLLNGAGTILRFSADGIADGVLVDSGLSNPLFLAFVPEPGSGVLLGIGLVAGLLSIARRRRQPRA